jgi:hypothetical protein
MRRQTAALVFIVLLLQLIPVAEVTSAAQRQHRHGATASAGGGSSSRRSASGASSSSSASYDDYAERTNYGNVRDFDESNADYEDGGASVASSSDRRAGGSSGGRRRDGGGDGDQRWPPENCTQCGARQVKRDYRIESIKSEILRKLRLSNPPNVTAARLPAIPHIQRIVDELSYQSDAPWSSHEQQQYDTDDDHATPLKVLIFAVPGE